MSGNQIQKTRSAKRPIHDVGKFMTAKFEKQTGRRERRRLETREKLFSTAMQLFAERGFFAVTTEQITEAADVGQGTFFNYFPTKQHVLTVLAQKQLEKAMAARQKAEAGESSIQEVLRGLVHSITEEPGRSQALARSLFTALISNDDVRELTRCTMGQVREIMSAIIALGQERGEIRVDRKPAEIALAFQRGTIGTLLLWTMQPQNDLAPWLDAAFCDFWAAMGKDCNQQAIRGNTTNANGLPKNGKLKKEDFNEPKPRRRDPAGSSQLRKKAAARMPR